ncbi:unnamed protein product [Dicrocoelium dendriticum]|nr:unnamed protein product [Dicrocoelium dendriticum]
MTSHLPSSITAILLLCLRMVDAVNFEKTSSCNRRLSGADTGNIHYPESSKTHEDDKFCNYAIEVPSKKRINLTFTDIWLQATCSALTDFVVVFDGSDCMSRRLGAVYEGEGTFISSTNKITALLISNEPFRTGRFSATYTAVTGTSATVPKSSGPNCGQELTAESGSISFHGTAQTNVLCIWRIRVPSGKTINLRITTLNLDAAFTSLRVLNGENCGASLIAYIYGMPENRPFTVNSTSNTLTLVLSSPFGFASEVIEATYSSIGQNTQSSSTKKVVGIRIHLYLLFATFLTCNKKP